MLNEPDTFMTRSTNFEFMRDKCAELADEAAEVEGLVHRAGRPANTLLCGFGEKLLQLFVLENGGSVNRAGSPVDGETIEFGQLLHRCENNSQRWHVPEPQRILLDRLRSEGNKTKHRLNSRQRFDALSLLHDAWSVAGWVWKQLQWGNAPEQFVEPPKGGREFHDERRQKIEALKRVAEVERACDVSGWICEDQRKLTAPKDFTGREWLFGRIKKFLADSECRVLLIQGQPGRGKTAIIQKLVSEGIPAGIAPFVFCFKDQSSQGEPRQWVRHLYASLVERWQLTQPDRSIKEADLEDLVQQLRNRIAEVAEKYPSERLLFVIDAVDEAGPAEKTVVSFLQSEFPNTVQVLVTARPGHVPLSPIQPPLDLDDPDLWNNHQADGRRFVTATIPSLEPDSIKKVVRLGDGNFLVLRGICRELRDVPVPGIAHHLRELDELKAIGRDLRYELYERTWKRLERLDADELDTIEKVAMLLANASAPLSERIIRDTLKLRRADWVKVQQHFGENLDQSKRHPPFIAGSIDPNVAMAGEENAEPTNVVNLFHGTFADFVRQHLKDDLVESKSQLADYCREQLKKPKPSYEYAYALRFGPAHLMSAAEHDPRHWNQLEELLTDIFFLEAKAQAGFVFDLATDLSSAWQAMPADRPKRTILKLLAEAIRREIYFIDEHADDYPQGLFQCVWNLAWWYGNPEAAPYYQHDAQNISQNGKVAEVDDPEADGQREVGTVLVQLLERWLREKKLATPGFHWLRSRRPPDVALGGEQLTVIPNSRGGGQWVNCSADGKRIVGGDTSSLRVWDADTLTEVARMPEWVSEKYRLETPAVSPDGNVVIVTCGEKRSLAGETENSATCPRLIAWDIRSGDVRTITHRHSISDIAFSPDGTRFATASSCDTSIRLWNAKTFDEVLVLPEPGVTSLCFSPDGRRIISGSDAIQIWDASNGQLINVFATNGEYCHSKVCVSPDETHIATNLNNDLVILDAETGDELVRIPNLDAVYCICFSPDGKRIAFGNTWGGLIRISDAFTGKTIRDILGHQVNSLCFLPDGKRILGGSLDGTIRIWNADSEPSAAVFLVGGNVDGFEPEDFEIGGFCFLENGKKLLCDSNGLQHSWDGQSGIALQVFETGTGWLKGSKYSANNERCGEFSSTDDPGGVFLQVRDTRTGEVLFARRLKGHWVFCKFSLSPDGTKIAYTDVASGEEHVTEIFDVSRGHELARLKGHEDAINHLCFSSDGARIATASQDRTVRIWDANTGELRTTNHHNAAVRKICFSPDGTQIVSFDAEGLLRLCDSATEYEQIVLDHHEQEINELCFSPNGARVVAEALGGDSIRDEKVSWDSWKRNDPSGYIFIWDAKTGELVKVIAGHGDIQAIAADVEDTSFRLMVRDGDTIVETASGQIAARYPGTCGQIATHPDGRTWAGTFSNYLALIHLEG